jgi:carboxylesterase
MEKLQLLNEALRPVDKMLDLSLTALRKTNLYEPAKQGFYETIKVVLGTQFKIQNQLRVFGTENVPQEGGCIFAINHQSWLDAQVITATSPRRLSFLAKAEFMNWPIMHHVIDISDAIYIKRGGDDEGLKQIASRLKDGACIAMFPEGTIPGEEDIPRWDVNPETGLLRGKTGVVRLALESGVPIVPVGVSGTGRAFPPETYPRLQELPPGGRNPIEVRFGEPVWLKERIEATISYEQLRGMTDRVMRSISQLVDHSMGYEPMSLPIVKKEAPSQLPSIPFRNKPLAEKTRFGVLILHGFTSHVSCVSDVHLPLNDMGLPYRVPVLRGHGGEWQELRGVKAENWYEDAENAMLDLLTECRKVIIVGLSMGGLVALDLAAQRRKEVAGVITLAAALKFQDPLAGLSGVLDKLVKSWPSPKAFHDKELDKQRNRNYPKFPTAAFTELYKYSKEVEHRLSFVAANALILHSRKDQVVHPRAAELIHKLISSPAKRVMWFERSGHEMLLDMESEEVMSVVIDQIRGWTATAGEEINDK